MTWRRRMAVVTLASWVVASAAPAWASSEVDALLNKLVEKKILTVEEAQEVRNDMAKDAGTVAKPREEDTKDVVKKMAGGSWLDTVKWSGDFRVRHESQFREPAVDRHRERMRLRMGLTAKPVKPLEIGVRLATGASGDPTGTNQSFTNTFDKKAIFIDKAYAKYMPWTWLALTGGKMENPFEVVPEGIVWDSDVTPEGVAAQWKSPRPGIVRPFANVGAFQVSELANDGGDPALFGFQGGADVDLPVPGWTWQPSAAYFKFDGFKGVKTSNINTATGTALGNTTATEGAATKYAFDYNVISFVSKVSIPDVLGQPVLIVGDFTKNNSAPDNNFGWMAGAEVGKVTEKFGSWRTFYYFKWLEPDATFAGIADSDFGAGGTNHWGHMLGAQMGLNKYASVGLKYYRTDELMHTGAQSSQNHVDTLQADVQTKW